MVIRDKWKTVHPPGSREALEEGCTCPVLDNAHGRGVCHNHKGELLYWIDGECPLHSHTALDEDMSIR